MTAPTKFERVGGRQIASNDAVAAATARHSATPSAFIAPILLDDEQSAAALCVGVRKFHELRAEAWMPKPVVLGPRMLRWARSELEAAVANMPRQQTAGAEPAELARARINRLKSSGVAS